MPQSPDLTHIQKKLLTVLEAYPEPPSVLMRQGNIGSERFTRKSKAFWLAQEEWEKSFQEWGVEAQSFAEQPLVLPTQRSVINRLIMQWMCPPLRLGELLQSVGWSCEQAAKFHVTPLCLQATFRNVMVFRDQPDVVISHHLDCVTQLTQSHPESEQSKMVRKIVDGGAHMVWRSGRLFEGGMHWNGANRWLEKARPCSWWTHVGKGFWKNFDSMCSEDLIQNHLNLTPVHPLEHENQMMALKKALEHEDFTTFLSLVPEPPPEAKGFLNLMHAMCGASVVYPPQQTVMKTDWLNQYMWDTGRVDPHVRMIFESLQSKKVLGEAIGDEAGVAHTMRKL